ncbi:uncharacterized protein BDZ83DRAFT_35774 [Colletotrichum acutatum]|uniref:Uncharacterized protein n=1 Tax=Glomerella acutata TaxID=27357 RepID=A0AAD8XLE1_GLOAC|nr:uncharacterized protein BDZ83DRAFT_35774 [Colletotrichum acutatum]KAK1729545.1 hypothetical protein BDZ83DRAFT_35774 [Colletotrichum acutatum]
MGKDKLTNTPRPQDPQDSPRRAPRDLVRISLFQARVTSKPANLTPPAKTKESVETRVAGDQQVRPGEHKVPSPTRVRQVASLQNRGLAQSRPIHPRTQRTSFPDPRSSHSFSPNIATFPGGVFILSIQRCVCVALRYPFLKLLAPVPLPLRHPPLAFFFFLHPLHVIPPPSPPQPPSDKGDLAAPLRANGLPCLPFSIFCNRRRKANRESHLPSPLTQPATQLEPVAPTSLIFIHHKQQPASIPNNGRPRQAPRVRRSSPSTPATSLPGLRLPASPGRPRRLRHPSAGTILLPRPGDELRPSARPLPTSGTAVPPGTISSPRTLPAPGPVRTAVPTAGRLLPGQPRRRLGRRHYGWSARCARVLLLS